MMNVKRLFFLLLFAVCVCFSAYAKIIDNSTEEVLLKVQMKHDQQKRIFFKQMAKVKYYIVNGDVDRATLELSKTIHQNSNLQFVANRYRAMIAFIKEDFETSYKILGHPFYKNNKTAMKEICVLQSFNMLALKKYKDLMSYFGMCKILQKNHLTNNFFWGFDTISLVLQEDRVMSGDFMQVKPEAFYNNDFLRSWLKEGLYYNQEKEIIKYVAKIPKKAYKVKEIRELLALTFYRTGNLEMSKQFIEDIHSPNAESIRGNIYMKENKPELAFGHFKLALKYKKNSLNAIERLIPLAWQLKQYDEAIDIINSYHAKKIEPIKKETLLVSHLLHLEEYDNAEAKLVELDKLHTHRMPHILNLMAMYTKLMKQKKVEMQKYANITCQEYDGLSCWLLMQSQIWTNITAFINDKKSIAPNARYELDQLQVASTVEPLRENKVIHQEEIEELDYGFYPEN